MTRHGRRRWNRLGIIVCSKLSHVCSCQTLDFENLYKERGRGASCGACCVSVMREHLTSAVKTRCFTSMVSGWSIVTRNAGVYGAKKGGTANVSTKNPCVGSRSERPVVRTIVG